MQIDTLPYRDIRQSNPWSDFWKRLGWNVAELDHDIRVRSYTTLFGTRIMVEKPRIFEESFLRELDIFARKKRTSYVRVDPTLGQEYSFMGKYKFQNVTKLLKPFVTTRGCFIDLSNETSLLWNNMSKTAKYLIRRVEKAGIGYKCLVNPAPGDLEIFYEHYNKNGADKNFPTLPYHTLELFSNIFGGNTVLFAALDKKNQYLGGGLFITYENAVWWTFTASSDLGKSVSIGYPLLWKSIQHFKEANYKYMDLGALYDERYKKEFKGHEAYSTFKLRFKPEVVYFPHPQIHYVNPLYKFFETR